jgi:hypothetical protein
VERDGREFLISLSSREHLHHLLPEPPLLQGEPTGCKDNPGERLPYPLPSLPRLELGARLVETFDLLVRELEIARLEVVLETVLLAGGAVCRRLKEVNPVVKKRRWEGRNVRDNDSALTPRPSEQDARLARLVVLRNLGQRLVEGSTGLVREGVERRVGFGDDTVLGVIGEERSGLGVDVGVKQDLGGARRSAAWLW